MCREPVGNVEPFSTNCLYGLRVRTAALPLRNLKHHLPKKLFPTGARVSCMQKAFRLMEWILLSTRTADCTDQIPISAAGTFSTPLRTLLSSPPLELRLHSSHEALVATMTGSPYSSRCSPSLLSLCHTSAMHCKARCLRGCAS
jgi:hypothetical protein